MKILVIGQGLAGSLAAFEFERRGAEVWVVDDQRPGAASTHAGGLAAPIAGQRGTLAPRFEERRTAALKAYSLLAGELDIPLWRELELWRIFPDDGLRQVYQRRSRDLKFSPYLGPEQDEIPQLKLTAPHKVRRIYHAGSLATRDLVAAWAARMTQKGRMRHECLAPELELKHFDWVLDARGLGARGDGLWPLRFQPTRGESLLIQSAQPAPALIIHGRVFALGTPDGLWRVGATYDRSREDLEPSAEGLQWLLEAAREFLPGELKVLRHDVGLRPNLLGHAPVLGAHPQFPRLLIANGYGSKGALWAPWCAERLADLIFEQKPIPPEYDVLRIF